MSTADLEAARDLARAGVPLFMARPDAAQPTGYRLPMRWEREAAADPALVDHLPEGWALCAVMGYGLDLVDLDPRNSDGAALPTLPPALATARTPSGGTHHFVLSLGLPSLDGVAPGLDYKGGEPTGAGRGFAFIAPTVRLSKVDGQPYPYQWVGPPDVRMLDAYREQFRSNHPMFESLRQAIMARREQRAEGVVRVVPESVAVREWYAALARLEADLRRWAASGWGGEAHAGLLAHTTHLARLAPEQAERSYLEAFARAGLTPDEADLAKLDSALRTAVPDQVVPDAELSGQELFWAGAEVAPNPFGPVLNGSRPPDRTGAFDFCDPAWLDHPPEPPEPAYGAFGGPRALLYAQGVHWLQGESESGKSWVAFAVALEVLHAGGSVIIVDYEDTRDAVLSRLRDLGIAAEELARLVYVGGHDVTHAELAGHLAGTDRDYALLVLDGVTSALSAAGLKGNDAQELTRWVDQVPRRARMTICVDHMVKSVDERNGNALGSQAKKSVVTASSFEVRATTKFGRGGTGTIELRLHKDKRGGVRGRAKEVTRLRFASDPGSGAVTLTAAGVTAGTTEGFLGQPLVAGAQLNVSAIVAAWNADPRSNPSQSQRVLWARAREMDYRGNKATMAAAYRAYVAGIVPMNPTPDPDADE